MSKEHAYAYEAGYRDGSINYELEHCPACKNVADLQEALAENAKLRELIYEPSKCDLCEAMLDCYECLRADVSHKRVRSLEAENAKLRELVMDMWDTSYRWLFSDKPSNFVTYEEVTALRDRIEELEVPL